MKNLLLNYSFKVKAYETRAEMGKCAAEEAICALKELLKVKEEINCIFAAAPSQNEFLSYLAKADIDWSRVNAFHMDEYIGLEKGDSRLFSSFLNDNIFSKVPFKNVYLINDAGNTREEKLENYSKLLKEQPVDITFMGIGENGHIAFNDPHVADFKDDKLIKVVDLDEKCRIQQVNDGCFASLEEVPMYAMTLTIPALMKAKKLFCMVPAKTKAEAVKETIFGEISEKCPATIMRRHADAALYLDKASAQYLL